jgi:hypothetical protein
VKAKRRRQRTVRPRGVTQELFASGPAMVRLCFCRNRLDGCFSINRLNVGGVTLGAAEMAEIVRRRTTACARVTTATAAGFSVSYYGFPLVPRPPSLDGVRLLRCA